MSHQTCRVPETPLALLPLVHLVAQLCLTLCDPVDCSLPGFSVRGDFLGKNTGLDSHFHKLWKILQEMGIPDRLMCLLRNMCAGQEATVRNGHGTMDWFQIGKGGQQGCILSPCLFNLYAEYILRNAGLDEAQAGIKIARRGLIGSWLEEAFRPARAPERFAAVLPAFSLAGARAGGSSRPRKAP